MVLDLSVNVSYVSNDCKLQLLMRLISVEINLCNEVGSKMSVLRGRD